MGGCSRSWLSTWRAQVTPGSEEGLSEAGSSPEPMESSVSRVTQRSASSLPAGISSGRISVTLLFQRSLPSATAKPAAALVKDLLRE